MTTRYGALWPKADPPPRPRHPVTEAQSAHRSARFQLRMADMITAFAGSMAFVWLHVAAFGLWMMFVEASPWPTLTLVVSLEAIFLSTFVMIGQNRQAAFQQAKADHDFVEEELELKTNTEITRAIHALTAELHERLIGDAAGVSSAAVRAGDRGAGSTGAPPPRDGPSPA